MVSLSVITVLIVLMFRVLPDASIAWRPGLLGALVTSVFFTIGKYAIGLYLGYAGISSAYGAAGSVVMLMVWVYYTSIILFVGAKITQVFSQRASPGPASPSDASVD